MARPSTAQAAVHAAAAALYAAGAVSTETSLGELIRKIAKSEEWLAAYTGSAETPEQVEVAVKKAIHRAYPDEANRAALLWEGVVNRAERPPTDRIHLSLSETVRVIVLGKLRTELRTKDPLFADVNVVLTRAEVAHHDEDRAAELRRAAELLLALQPTVGAVADEADRASRTSRLSRLAAAWAQVYDTAIGDSGPVSDQLAAVAEDAVRAGLAARQEMRELRPTGIIFGQRRHGPRRVAWHGTNVWVAAIAVLGVVRGVAPHLVVDHTRDWAVEHLGVEPESVSAGEVLAQAANSLLRLGRRTDAKEALEAAWASGDTGHVWEALLDMSITLSALMFAHGDRAGAATVLSEGVRGELDGEYPGDPEDGWGSSVDYQLYLLIRQALDDPHAAVGTATWRWADEVGAGGFRRSSWALTGVLVELQSLSGRHAEAAWLAELAPVVLAEPASIAERQVEAHLSGMCSTDRVPAAEGTKERMALLLSELLALVLRSPDAVEYDQGHVLSALITVVNGSRVVERRRPTSAA
jgi:hypothetical protein